MSDDIQEKKIDEIPAAAPAAVAPEEEQAAALPAEAVPPEGGVPGPGPEGGEEGSPEKPAPRKHRKHEHDPARALKEKLERREQEIETLRREITEWKDRCLRSAAEMDNTRKRLEREKADFLQFSQAELFKELLAVLDNFERARRTGEEPESKGFQAGIDLIHKQFTDLLRKRGVTPWSGPTGASIRPSTRPS